MHLVVISEISCDKLRHIYIELPRFVKQKSECDSFFECWIYNLANMKQMKEMSFKDRDAIFGRLEQLASRANMSKEERLEYRESWKINNDYFNSLDYAKKEGRAEEKLQIAHNLKSMGLSNESIMKATGLSIEEIEKL